MAKSIRGTFTRPDTTSVWAMYVFFPTTVENITFFENLGVRTYMKGDPTADLTLVVDHVFADSATFDSLKDVVYTRIPAWTIEATRAEATEYATDNGQTLELTEVDDPDLSEYTAIIDVPVPTGI